MPLFQPGQSGNPSGRPKGVAFGVVLAEKLEEVKNGKTTRERLANVVVAKALKGDLAAAQWIIERVDGKVKDQADHSVTGEVLVRVLRDRAGGAAPLRPAPEAATDPGGSAPV